jgi:hypothetical protein
VFPNMPRAGARKARPLRQPETDVESLLKREQRAQLPLGQQLLLYLDPFRLFKDASRGSEMARAVALNYNRAMRWILVAYIRRWVMIAATLFLAIAPAEAAAAQARIFIIPAAAFAVGACIAVTVAVVTIAVYLLLGSRRE